VQFASAAGALFAMATQVDVQDVDFSMMLALAENAAKEARRLKEVALQVWYTSCRLKRPLMIDTVASHQRT
jgi:hypothetical protein